MGVEPSKGRPIDPDALRLEIAKKVVTVIEQFTAELDREAMEHKEKFKDAKLVDLFPSTIGYYFEKVIIGSTSTDYNFDLGKAHIEPLNEIVAGFKVGLISRGEYESGSPVAYEIEDVEYPLNQLARYFAKDPECYLNSRDAYIFSCYLRERFDVLKQMATEYDEKYSAGI